MSSFTKQSERAGRWMPQSTGEASYSAFIPAPLPPIPPILVDSALQRQIEAAGLALGRLDGIGRLLPGPEELLYSYIRKEAVLSSQIEGTQSSIADLLLHENQAVPGVMLEDVQEVSNYIGALSYGVEWEEWLIFFLDGVTTIAHQATEKIRALLALFERDRKAVEQSRKGSIYQSVAVQSNLTVYDYLKKRIAIRIPETAEACGTTKPTVKRAIDDLEQLGIVIEATGKPRNKVYIYKQYLDILDQDDDASSGLSNNHNV